MEDQFSLGCHPLSAQAFLTTGSKEGIKQVPIIEQVYHPWAKVIASSGVEHFTGCFNMDDGIATIAQAGSNYGTGYASTSDKNVWLKCVCDHGYPALQVFEIHAKAEMANPMVNETHQKPIVLLAKHPSPRAKEDAGN